MNWHKVPLGMHLILAFVLLSVGFTLCRYTDLGNLAEWITAGMTLALVLVAWIQLHAQTFAQRQWATLQACNQYDTEEVLNSSRAKIAAYQRGEWRHYQNGKWRGGDGIFDVVDAFTNIFNFFDAIALGLDQGLYVEEIVRAHLKAIVFAYWDILQELKKRHEQIEKFDKSFEGAYSTLFELMNEWKREGQTSI